MDEQINDYIEQHPEDQAVDVLEAEAEQTRPKKKAKKPVPAVSRRTEAARAAARAKLAAAGR